MIEEEQEEEVLLPIPDLFVAVGLLGTASLLGISTAEWTRRGSSIAGFKARGKVRLSLPNTGTLVLDPVLLACETGPGSGAEAGIVEAGCDDRVSGTSEQVYSG
ncbi:hypothetical protein Q3G72_020699 [Acer saccharum]|nr:hypothetical protein Q3G72_020699 [Acer saccharum]